MNQPPRRPAASQPMSVEEGRTVYAAVAELTSATRSLIGTIQELNATIREWHPMERPRQASIHDIVEATTGVHGTETTPPLLALGQKLWWRAGVVGLGLLGTVLAEYVLHEIIARAVGGH